MSDTSTNTLKEETIYLLLSLFMDTDGYDLTNYQAVDDFYAHIGYDLEGQPLLEQLGIQGTSDLQKALTQKAKETNSPLNWD